MPQIILLIVGAIVLGIIKALTTPPPKPQPRSQSPKTLGAAKPDSLFGDSPGELNYTSFPVESKPPFKEAVAKPVTPTIKLAVSPNAIVQGFIMAELLGPPVAKRSRHRQ